MTRYQVPGIVVEVFERDSVNPQDLHSSICIIILKEPHLDHLCDLAQAYLNRPRPETQERRKRIHVLLHRVGGRHLLELSQLLKPTYSRDLIHFTLKILNHFKIPLGELGTVHDLKTLPHGGIDVGLHAALPRVDRFESGLCDGLRIGDHAPADPLTHPIFHPPKALVEGILERDEISDKTSSEKRPRKGIEGESNNREQTVPVGIRTVFENGGWGADDESSPGVQLRLLRGRDLPVLTQCAHGVNVICPIRPWSSHRHTIR